MPWLKRPPAHVCLTSVGLVPKSLHVTERKVIFLMATWEKAPTAQPRYGLTGLRRTWLPGCCSCCWWSASDILSKLSQAWIIGSWNQLKHEPADEGSCCSLNCSLTVKKSICGGGLLPSRRERWPSGAARSFVRATVFVSNWVCATLLAPDYARSGTKAAW